MIWPQDKESQSESKVETCSSQSEDTEWESQSKEGKVLAIRKKYCETNDRALMMNNEKKWEVLWELLLLSL